MKGFPESIRERIYSQLLSENAYTPFTPYIWKVCSYEKYLTVSGLRRLAHSHAGNESSFSSRKTKKKELQNEFHLATTRTARFGNSIRVTARYGISAGWPNTDSLRRPETNTVQRGRNFGAWAISPDTNAARLCISLGCGATFTDHVRLEISVNIGVRAAFSDPGANARKAWPISRRPRIIAPASPSGRRGTPPNTQCEIFRATPE